MNAGTTKTALGAIIALGAMANLLRHTGPFTRDDVLIHSAFLLFAGVLIDPQHFKALLFWRKDGEL